MAPLLVGLLVGVAFACADDTAPRDEEVAVEVGRVALDVHRSPVVILVESDGDRELPIWIGAAEARSIAVELESFDLPRPNTHDLAKRLVDGLDGEILRVVVTELRESTYYALVFLRANGSVVEIDSRPSDAIALALRTDTPIYVRGSVFESAARASVEPDRGRPI